MSDANANKRRVLELFERVLNGHNTEVLLDYTTNPAVVGSVTHLLHALPDLEVSSRWIVAEEDRVVAFLDVRGTHLGPWLIVNEPTGRSIEAAIVLTLQFDDHGQIVDQWLGSNFIDLLAQMGWGFAPVGETARAL